MNTPLEQPHFWILIVKKTEKKTDSWHVIFINSKFCWPTLTFWEGILSIWRLYFNLTQKYSKDFCPKNITIWLSRKKRRAFIVLFYLYLACFVWNLKSDPSFAHFNLIGTQTVRRQWILHQAFIIVWIMLGQFFWKKRRFFPFWETVWCSSFFYKKLNKIFDEEVNSNILRPSVGPNARIKHNLQWTKGEKTFEENELHNWYKLRHALDWKPHKVIKNKAWDVIRKMLMSFEKT